MFTVYYEWLGVFAVIGMALYNGQRGKNARVNRFMKWFFYIYYPAHLFVIGLLSVR